MDKKKILLVEDNTNDLLLIERAIKICNIVSEIVIAHDGLEALDYLFGLGAYKGRDLSDMPALVLLDVNLPIIGGLEVLKKIRGDNRTDLIPVVILTSLKEDQCLIKAYKLGANSYICKPVDFEQFVEAIRQLDLYWLVLNEPPPVQKQRQSAVNLH